jgi:Alginate export
MYRRHSLVGGRLQLTLLLAILAWAGCAARAGAQQRDSLPLRGGVELRARFEHLGDDFRADHGGNVHALMLRTLLREETSLWLPSWMVFELEIEDARAYASDGAPLNTTLVDALEILQGSVDFRRADALTPGDDLSVRLGLVTMDVGSRRVVARSVFRNTINNFFGIDIDRSAPHSDLRVFLVNPVTRLPADAVGLADNRIERDRVSDAVLWGVTYGSSAIVDGVLTEAYLIGLHEGDGDPSPNRRLLTPGIRVLRAPAPGRPDFEIEAMAQLGTSRATADPSDTTDLKQRAFSAHASAGYLFHAAWAPRFSLAYDYASGDRDPSDGENNRFDPLFGARAFELGPSGVYGALARSNLSSFGARVEAAPSAALDLMAAYRLSWLASSRDAWVTAGLQDSTGVSGSFIGRQLEGRVRARPFGDALTIEVGAARLGRGDFARAAAGRDDAALYFYSQVTLSGGVA